MEWPQNKCCAIFKLETIMDSRLIKAIQLTREICYRTKSDNLFDIIHTIVSDICQHRVGIVITDYYETTSIEFSKSEFYDAIIRLKIKDDETTEQVLWNILHEYGHFLSGKPDKISITREIEAWNKAYLVLLKYPQLVSLEQSFFGHQEICLGTYFAKKQNV